VPWFAVGSPTPRSGRRTLASQPALERTRTPPHSPVFRCIHCLRTPRLHGPVIEMSSRGARSTLRGTVFPPSCRRVASVGCFYHMVSDFESARRYFSKATTLNHRFAPAWVGFGHAFAAQDESDQAIAAYRTAHGSEPTLGSVLWRYGTRRWPPTAPRRASFRARTLRGSAFDGVPYLQSTEPSVGSVPWEVW